MTFHFAITQLIWWGKGAFSKLLLETLKKLTFGENGNPSKRLTNVNNVDAFL